MLHQKEIQMVEIEGGSVVSPKGFKAGGIHCGIRRKKKDLGVLISEQPAVAAAVYTMNSFQAAPLLVTKQTLEQTKKIKGLIVNSGNANAFTGKQGLVDAYTMQKELATHYGLATSEVVVTSTGVIGEKMPMDVIREGIAKLPIELDENSGLDFGEAILTTDTFVKAVAVELEIDGKKVVIGGTAKGSGMIHPNMATMLAFVTTDANIEQEHLQMLLSKTTDKTYNMITVDGDTSTNDMVLVMANGMAENETLSPTHPEWYKFAKGFYYVSQELAKMIARDGEGATKLVTVAVDGAVSSEMAHGIAKKIIASNLVKTAIFGADGNWGRVVCAIGNSGFQVDENRLDITIGETLVVSQGEPTIYEEEIVTESLKQEEVLINVNLHLGEESAIAWGCDLSYEYVRINGSYRS